MNIAQAKTLDDLGVDTMPKIRAVLTLGTAAKGNQPVNMSTLAAASGISTAGITGLVDTLAGVGILRRVHHAGEGSDRRRITVELLSKGFFAHSILTGKPVTAATP